MTTPATPHPAAVAEGGGETEKARLHAALSTIRAALPQFSTTRPEVVAAWDALDRLRDYVSALPAPAAPGEDAARLEAALPDLIGCCAKCGRRLTVILNVEHANPHYRIETLCQCGAELHLWRRAARAQEGR